MGNENNQKKSTEEVIQTIINKISQLSKKIDDVDAYFRKEFEVFKKSIKSEVKHQVKEEVLKSLDKKWDSLNTTVVVIVGAFTIQTGILTFVFYALTKGM